MNQDVRKLEAMTQVEKGDATARDGRWPRDLHNYFARVVMDEGHGICTRGHPVVAYEQMAAREYGAPYSSRSPHL